MTITAWNENIEKLFRKFLKNNFLKSIFNIEEIYLKYTLPILSEYQFDIKKIQYNNKTPPISIEFFKKPTTTLTIVYFASDVICAEEKLQKFTSLFHTKFLCNIYFCSSQQDLLEHPKIQNELRKFRHFIVLEHYEHANNITLKAWQNGLTYSKSDLTLFVCDESNLHSLELLLQHSSYVERWDNSASLLNNTKLLKQKNGFDFFYYAVESGISDLLSPRPNSSCRPIASLVVTTNKEDQKRFEDKYEKGYFKQKVIYIPEALGDNILAWEYILQYGKDAYVKTCYPWLYSNIMHYFKGFWEHSFINDQGNGMLGFNVYNTLHLQNCKTLKEAYFIQNGEEYKPLKDFSYPYNYFKVKELKEKYKNYILIYPHTPPRNNEVSNKSWNYSNWEQVVTHLQNKDLKVLQIGTKNDKFVSNVNEQLTDLDITDLAALIVGCRFWIGVDTFLHHFSSFLKKRGILLTPCFNELAEWQFNENIKMYPGINWSNQKTACDNLQPARKISMDLIKVEHVTRVIDSFIESLNYSKEVL